MARPRIIIADTDIRYIIPFQIKFAEDFFEKVDIEIITDEDYFNELFATPQSAEILIVSEDLYDMNLQKHNISNVFVMTEQQDEKETTQLNIVKIFKYTSIKEIFSEIMGKSADALNITDSEKKETQIVLVYSACGGTGKTTVALGVSACLTRNYKKVLYINAAHLQTFQSMLENDTPISATDVYARLSNANENVYADIKHVIRKETFSYLPPFKAALMSLGLKYSVYENIVISAKKTNDYDFIIIDAEASFDEDKARLLNIADKVIVVTTQTMASVVATNILVSNVNGIGGEKYIFVCNDFDKEKDNAIISPNISIKFTVSDYIEHFKHYEQMKIDDFVKEDGIQKTTFLIA